jgi:hypothetical protein
VLVTFHDFVGLRFSHMSFSWPSEYVSQQWLVCKYSFRT